VDHKLIIAPTTLQDTEPLEYIEAAIKAGYDGIGLRVHRSPGLPYFPLVDNDELIRDVRLWLGRFPVFDLYSFYLEPDTNVRDFAPAMHLGAALGAKYATVMGADSNWSRLRDNFAATCELAKVFGLTCSVEFAVIRPLATLAQTVRLIEESGQDAVICVDPLHLARCGATPDDLKALPAKYFPYAQISDGLLEPGEPNPALFGKLGMGQRKMPGEGMLPLREMLAALPPGIPLSVELPHSLAPTMSAHKWAKTTLQRTREYLSGG
jgi:sugar phosphate isomerase/epimerase